MPFFAEHFNEVWSNFDVNVQELIEECPPAMASSMTHLLYGRVVSTVPIFRGCATEVIGAICMRCQVGNKTRNAPPFFPNQEELSFPYGARCDLARQAWDKRKENLK